MLARPQFWLVKSETEVYPYAALVAEKRTEWTGVRNYGARNALRAMNVGELVLFYHSQEDKAVVGVAKVSREAKPDPTAPDEDWSSVELVPYCAFTKPVTLAQMRAKPALADLMLLRQGRLSVMALERAHFAEIVAMSATTLPG
ncbi:MAG: EVE domain-containing protein [Deltaproteobacteria bacterium]|nr:EVE domain-containing protein [Deltaproteobacteria bacterium]